jgi:hypothetical protein
MAILRHQAQCNKHTIQQTNPTEFLSLCSATTPEPTAMSEHTARSLTPYVVLPTITDHIGFTFLAANVNIVKKSHCQLS